MSNFGLMNDSEGTGIYDMLVYVSKQFKFCNIVEIGVWDGRTGIEMCRIMASTGTPFFYYGIDKNIFNSKKLQWSENAVLIEGDANDALNMRFMPNEIHFLLIDGCHCKECVIRQSEMFLWRIPPCGIVAYHDTSIVSQGDPMSFACEGKTIDVISALNELKIENIGFELIREESKDERHGIRFYKRK